MRKIVWGAILALSMPLSLLTSCQSDDDLATGKQDGKGTSISVDVNYPGFGVNTRTSLEEIDGDMIGNWAKGDKLLITNATGNNVGTLELTDGAGTKQATFIGKLSAEVTDGTHDFTFTYLGSEVNPEVVSTSSYQLNFATQDGNAAELNQYDVFSGTAKYTMANGTSYAKDGLQFNKLLALGHFELKFPEGVSLTNGEVHISGENLKSSADINLADGKLTNLTDGEITVSETNGDFYITMIPATNIAPTFKANVGGVEYAGSLDARTWSAGEFIRAGHKEGVPVVMEEVGGDEPENPSSPGNMDNWGGDVAYPQLKQISIAKIGSSSNAWCNNQYSFQEFGFAAPFEYKSNAIKNGYLTSASYTNGAEAKYFQWGRWLGFPSYVSNAKVTMTSYASSGTIAPPRGVNFNSHYQLYYCWDMDSRPSYAYSSAFSTNGMKQQQAVNSSIIYLVGEYDYLSSSLQNLSWQERSGNPCPDGYRIPTAEELSIFVPSVNSFSGSHAEVKTIDNIKYAMKWTVVDATHVSVSSVRTSNTTVSASDAIFNNAKTITFEASGMLYSERGDAYFATSFNGGEKTSGYWSSSVGNLEGHNAGQALMIRIKSGACSIRMESVEYTAGLCIIPFKDKTATATAISPWSPLGY